MLNPALTARIPKANPMGKYPNITGTLLKKPLLIASVFLKITAPRNNGFFILKYPNMLEMPL